MHWRKLGLVFSPQALPERPPWLAEFAQAPATLLFDDRVRVFFSCRPPAGPDGMYVSRSAFVDLDRGDLTRVLGVSDEPILPLGGPGEFDEFGTYPVSVVRDGDSYRAYYAGWTRCESVPFTTAIGMATSADAVTFEKAGRGPVIPYTPDEPFVMSGPKVRRFGEAWQLFYIAGRRWKVVDGRPEPVYKIRMATSSDGIARTKHGEDLVESRAEPDTPAPRPDGLPGAGQAGRAGARRPLPHVLLLPVQQQLPRQGVRLPDRLRAQHRPDHLAARRRPCRDGRLRRRRVGRGDGRLPARVRG